MVTCNQKLQLIKIFKCPSLILEDRINRGFGGYLSAYGSFCEITRTFDLFSDDPYSSSWIVFTIRPVQSLGLLLIKSTRLQCPIFLLLPIQSILIINRNPVVWSSEMCPRVEVSTEMCYSVCRHVGRHFHSSPNPTACITKRCTKYKRWKIPLICTLRRHDQEEANRGRKRKAHKAGQSEKPKKAQLKTCPKRAKTAKKQENQKHLLEQLTQAIQLGRREPQSIA